MAERFIVSCYGLVFDSGNLLMVKQRSGFWATKWVLPGGKLELGESLENCVEREVYEETYCRVKAVRQLGVVTSYSPDSQFDKQVVLIFYLCKYVDGEPAKGDGVDASEWVDEDRFIRYSANDIIPPQVFDAVSKLCSRASFPDVHFDFIGAMTMAVREGGDTV